MAKLKGAVKRAFLRRMALGRLKKNRQSNKPGRSRSGSTMARKGSKLKHVFHRRSIGKMNLKKEATKAGIGLGLGLAIKYGVGFFTRNNPQAAEWTRRGANIGAAFGGVPGELAFQFADYGMNQLLVMQGGSAPGTGPGEAA